MLLASGIIDECCAGLVPAPQYYPCAGFLLWVWNLVLVVGLDGVAHCWVLKNHASFAGWLVCRLVGVGVSSGPPSRELALLVWVSGLVGWLFDVL